MKYITSYDYKARMVDQWHRNEQFIEIIAITLSILSGTVGLIAGWFLHIWIGG